MRFSFRLLSEEQAKIGGAIRDERDVWMNAQRNGTDLTKLQLNQLARKRKKPRRVSELSTALEAK